VKSAWGNGEKLPFAWISIERLDFAHKSPTSDGKCELNPKKTEYFLLVHILFHCIPSMKCFCLKNKKITVAANGTRKLKEWCHGLFFNFNRRNIVCDITDNTGRKEKANRLTWP